MIDVILYWADQNKGTYPDAARLYRCEKDCGCPDMCLPAPISWWNALYIYIGDDGESQNKAEWIKYLRGNQCVVVECKTIADAIECIERYLNNCISRNGTIK